jgi:site-specific recombinase XerC
VDSVFRNLADELKRNLGPIAPEFVLDQLHTSIRVPLEILTAYCHDYDKLADQFFAWCDGRHLALAVIRPFDVATHIYIETRGLRHSAPDVKLQLTAVRMSFDWLTIGRVVAVNPTAAVRDPKHVVITGKTPVLEATEWSKLLDFQRNGESCTTCATVR